MTHDGGGFGDALERLKRDGCNVLVTGEVDEPVTARAVRKLLGAPTERRERVLVVTDPDVAEPATHLPGNLYPSHEEVTVVDRRRQDGGPQVSNPETDCAEIREAVLDATAPYVGADPADGRVRVALVTLCALADAHGEEAAEAVAAVLTDRVTAVSGIGQYHLRVPDGSARVRRLSEHFDARIELRQIDDMVPEQRWHIPQFDQRSEWMTL